MLLKKIFITSIFLLSSFAFAHGQMNDESIKQMIQVVDYLNQLCRGGSGDRPETAVACNNRDKLTDVFRKAGWCYGAAGQPSYLSKWEKCSSQVARQPADPIPTPAQQECNLLIATTASAAIWRDNGVPLSTAQRNVTKVLDNMTASGADKLNWINSVASIYASTLTSSQISEKLKGQCKFKPKANHLGTEQTESSHAQ
jgi:hypothetical protein